MIALLVCIVQDRGDLLTENAGTPRTEIPEPFHPSARALRQMALASDYGALPPGRRLHVIEEPVIPCEAVPARIPLE